MGSVPTTELMYRPTIAAACLLLPGLVTAQGERTGDAGKPPPPKALQPGTNLVELRHDGHLRKMLVRLPADYDTAKDYPVIFGFHGAGGPMEGYHRQLERLVDRHGVISVSPQGISNARKVTGWNGFDGHRISNTDDVGFVRKAVDHLGTRASIDRKRLYATGGSSGAIFCFRLAIETDLFAAIAPMRASMIDRLRVPDDHPGISILLVCGADDPLFKGGERARGEVFHSAPETMALWAASQKSGGKPRRERHAEHATITRYSPEEARHELLLYAVEGSGHKLGRRQMTEAIDFMGTFFARHPAPPEAP